MKLHQDDLECFRNVFKSVHGFNPDGGAYPTTVSEYFDAMADLNSYAEWEERQRRADEQAEANAYEAAFAPAPAAKLADLWPRR